MSEGMEHAAELGRFRPYPEYKDSASAWLQEIPSHWSAKRLKYVAPVSDSRLYEPDSELPYVALENIESSTGRLTGELSPETAESTMSTFQEGDVLFGKLRPYLAKVVHADFSGKCSTELIVLRASEEGHPRALSYQLLSAGFIDWINAMTYGTKMPRANPDQVAGTQIAVAPLPEQRAIAEFLDRETGKIDALVAKKERLIELLQEKRTALITHAVTKGLDPTAPTKPSGIPWLGNIPAHWEMSPLSTVCGFQSGKAHEPFIDEDGNFVCVNSRFVSTEGRTAKFCHTNLSPAKRDDVLMVMSDLPNGRALAKAFYVTEDERYAVNQRVCILTAQTIHPKFLFCYLNRSPFFLRYDDGINQTHLPNAAFTKCPVLVPDQSEQVEIAAYLDRKTREMGELIEAVGVAVRHLKEFRTALISAAVTGKIDVREELT